MNKLNICVPSAVSVTASNSAAGWYGGALCIPDADHDFRDEIEQPFFDKDPMDSSDKEAFGRKLMKKGVCKPGDLHPDWLAAAIHTDRQVCYFDKDGCRELSHADRIYGPVSPKCETEVPLLVWSEQKGEQWNLYRYLDGKTESVFHADTMIGTPSATVWKGNLYVAFRHMGSTFVIDQEGSVVGRYDIKYPVLCSAGKSLWLAGELRVPEEGIDILLMDITDLDNPSCYKIHQDELNLHPDLVYWNGRLCIAFESRPHWGMDHCLSMTNDLHVWYVSKGKVSPLAVVPMPKEGFLESHGQFVMSIHLGYVRLFSIHGKLILSCRRFNCDGFRRNRWDTCVSFFDGDKFAPFGRVCNSCGASDTAFSVVGDEDGKSCVAILPVFDEEDLSAEQNLRAEAWRFDDKEQLLELPHPAGAHKAPYQTEMSALGIEKKYKPFMVQGYRYVTGDIHDHSAYSKCMSGIDGSPDELVRWYVDLLGNKVVCLTDHLDRVAHPLYTWLTDRVEELSEDAVVLYGNEPSVSPDHDTNFYEIDRTASDISRLASLYSVRRSVMYKVLKNYLPAGSVGCFRHCHGRSEIHTLKTLETWDPELEWNMEALQLRGNIILGESHEMSLQHFPCNFLNHGCKVGITGGTDHNLDIMNNRLGMTGFWIKDKGTVNAECVFEAMKERRLTAFSNGFVQIWCDINGVPMGGEVSVDGYKPLMIHAQVSAAYGIHRIALLRDGELMPWIEVGKEQFDGMLEDAMPEPGIHWYTVVACCESIFEDESSLSKVSPMMLQGRDNAGPMKRNEHSMAFTSPIFVKILGE